MVSVRTAKVFVFMLLVFSFTVSCMTLEPVAEEEFDWEYIPKGDGLFIVNEGNFMYGTATLSFYIPSEKNISNEVFARANSMKLGDVAQSMVIHDDKGYIAVNNSGVVYVIDINTFKVTGLIEGLVSPRYVHIVDAGKGYISDLYSSSITVFDPATLKKTAAISTAGHKSTEQMVRYGKYVFVNCWSYDNKVLVIDTDTDKVVEEIEVGIQPTSMVIDRNDKIWVLTDGGYKDSPYGWEEPALLRIDAATRKVEKKFTLEKEAKRGSGLALNGDRDQLYYLSESVWRMSVNAEQLPLKPLIETPSGRTTLFHGLAVNPINSEVYVADAIDYRQSGIIYRYSPEGELIDYFRTGIIPRAFCFR